MALGSKSPRMSVASIKTTNIASLQIKGFGTTTITAHLNETPNYEGADIRSELNVQRPKISFGIPQTAKRQSDGSYEIFDGTYPFNAIFNTTCKISYESSNPEIANIDANGNVNALKTGNTQLIAKTIAYGIEVPEHITLHVVNKKQKFVDDLTASLSDSKSESLTKRDEKIIMKDVEYEPKYTILRGRLSQNFYDV